MSIILPTRRGMIMLFASVVSLGVALINVSFTTAMTSATLISITIASFIMALFSISKVKITRLMHQDGRRYEPLQLPLQAVNSGQWRQPAMVVKEYSDCVENGVIYAVVPSLAPGETCTVAREISPVRRGAFHLNKLFLIRSDPAGLFFRRNKIELPTELLIYPHLTPNVWLPLKIRHNSIIDFNGHTLGRSGQGQEFFGIREYRHRDEYRLIDWKATAAKQRLMVREFEASAIKQIVIMLDTEKSQVGIDPGDNNFEFLIETATAIINYLADMYCHCHFFTWDHQQQIHLSGYSSNLKMPIIEALSLLQSSDVPLTEQFNQCVDYVRPNSIFYCLSMSAPTELQRIFPLLLEQDIDIRWIYAPRKCFPLIDCEKPRIVRKNAIPDENLFVDIVPQICTFQTDIVSMLKNE